MKKYGFLLAEMLSLDTDSKGPLTIKVYISYSELKVFENSPPPPKKAKVLYSDFLAKDILLVQY